MVIAICDDDPVWNKKATDIIEKYFSDQDREADVICFETGEQLFSHHGEPIDVLLMDIRLEEENGIDLVTKINSLWESCQIVYCTDYFYYAMDVYETRHTYFVVKSQFEERLPRVFDQIRIHEMQEKAEVYFRVIGEGMRCFPIKDILYFERRVRYTVVYTDEDSAHIREKIPEIMAALPDDIYTRCHNSYLVMMEKIQRREGHAYILRNEDHIPISRNYLKPTKNDFLRWCERYMK